MLRFCPEWFLPFRQKPGRNPIFPSILLRPLASKDLFFVGLRAILQGIVDSRVCTRLALILAKVGTRNYGTFLNILPYLPVQGRGFWAGINILNFKNFLVGGSAERGVHFRIWR